VNVTPVPRLRGVAYSQAVDEPVILDLPVGLDAPGHRDEHDSLGTVQVPADRYWGAQTQRALEHFAISDDRDRMPTEIIHAYGLIKEACAQVNGARGRLPGWMASLIARVAREVATGQLDDHFPLRIWQSGSGTQTNMNVNEVIANRCNQLLGAPLGAGQPVHPNDHVNRSQSSNDTFPTAMHLAALGRLRSHLLPQIDALAAAIAERSDRWSEVVKVGRTHLQDATPLTVGQEWSGWAAALFDARMALIARFEELHHIALGGTAVGTGVNAPAGFDVEVAAALAELSGLPLVTAPNKFAALGTVDPLVRSSGALRDLAVTLFKIANDIRWLASGPRSGLGELLLPANEPGSSIMPGKVNPSQAEVLLMVATQVLGNDATVVAAGKEGSLQLNTFRPVVIANVLHSMRVLADAAESFRRHLIEGTELNVDRLRSDVDRSVMTVTALTPMIGYERAAEIAHRAIAGDLTVRQAALEAGVEPELLDALGDPRRLTQPEDR
jgi:fumarate hydratase class II